MLDNMEKIIIKFDNGTKKEYPKGIKLIDIISDVKKDYSFDIICAKFKNQLIGYNDSIMKSGELTFYDITTSQGNKIYERGLVFLFEVCALHVLGNDTKIKIRYPIDKGIYCEIDKKVSGDEQHADGQLRPAGAARESQGRRPALQVVSRFETT